MSKIYNYFEKICSDNKIGHAFLIGNTTYEECKNDVEKVISDFFFKQNVNIEENSDIYVIKPDGSLITKNQIKELLTKLSTTSQINGIKVYIITCCENLSDSVYNTLLKTIEEPGEGIYAFLISSNIESVGATIKSRCQQIFISSSSINQIDEKYYELAMELIKNIEKYGIKTIGLQAKIYKNITTKEILKYVLDEMYNIYMKVLYSKVNYSSENIDSIFDNDSIEEIENKILVINEIKEKNSINIGKDVIIDKLIVDLWRCKK